MNSMRRSISISEDASSTAEGLNVAGRASMVNRTHRVVRERANSLNARRDLMRSLWFPMAVSSAMLVILCSTVWSVFEQYEVIPSGVPESGDLSFILLLWFLPISVTVLAAVCFRRMRGRSGEDATR